MCWRWRYVESSPRSTACKISRGGVSQHLGLRMMRMLSGRERLTCEMTTNGSCFQLEKVKITCSSYKFDFYDSNSSDFFACAVQR
mmetsp:Transcript_64760/g.171394  ORF Transcript_64760/g.171394 Transcript_64760/m.171394 type:complete len:85 (-) Transcript_64760:24-278(-)